MEMLDVETWMPKVPTKTRQTLKAKTTKIKATSLERMPSKRPSSNCTSMAWRPALLTEPPMPKRTATTKPSRTVQSSEAWKGTAMMPLGPQAMLSKRAIPPISGAMATTCSTSSAASEPRLKAQDTALAERAAKAARMKREAQTNSTPEGTRPKTINICPKARMTCKTRDAVAKRAPSTGPRMAKKVLRKTEAPETRRPVDASMSAGAARTCTKAYAISKGAGLTAFAAERKVASQGLPSS
mmetsp:Transcript_23119/g.65193  ORF Transcript_23119/g.65193 Transcript_23119/m.65193 type:complete len:241 (+) Transcript_23119:1095-1817(+)